MKIDSTILNLKSNALKQNTGFYLNVYSQFLLYFVRVRNKFFSMVDAGQTKWEDTESRDILRSIMMTTCDIAAITKPWEVQKKVWYIL